MTSQPLPPDEAAPVGRLRSILQICALFGAVVLVGSNAFVLSPILTEVGRGLNAAPTRIAWAISCFGAATALSSFFLAPAIDRVPASRMLALAAAILALAQALSGLSQGWAWLCGAQALAGVGVGILLPGTYATAAATAPAGREGARLGIVLTGWALSLVLAVPAAAFVATHFGWRSVYGLLATLSAVVALGLLVLLPSRAVSAGARVSPRAVLQIPGVGLLLVVVFLFMTAFYGTFAYYGEGIRAAFNTTAGGSGLFVLLYGVGFGLAGIALGVLAPRMGRRYVVFVLLAIAAVYTLWAPALADQRLGVLMAVAWGFTGQLSQNALVVTLTRQGAAARGAVMGMNSAVTYSAVFAGPMLMGWVYAAGGFGAVTTLSGVFAALGGLIVARGGRAAGIGAP